MTITDAADHEVAYPPVVDVNGRMKQAAEAGNDQVADLRHTDELNRMKSRLFGLEAAVAGASSFGDCDEREGVLQIISDVCHQMKNCAEAFENMRQLRLSKCCEHSQESST